MNSWKEFFFLELQKSEIKSLLKKVIYDYDNYIIFPKKDNYFQAFKLTPYDKVRVVILGQDPYHEENQAMGLSFSVSKGCSLPKSLINIFKEYTSDLNYPFPKSGDLSPWARNGVLLLNTVLHVKKSQALSCYYPEYDVLMEDIIKFLNASNNKIVFMLWGKNAAKYEKYINSSFHYIIKSAHPSPLSSYRGFFSSKPFSKTNEFFKNNNLPEIDWKL